MSSRELFYLTFFLLKVLDLENLDIPSLGPEVDIVNSRTAAVLISSLKRKNRLRWKSLLSHSFQVPRPSRWDRLEGETEEWRRVRGDVGAIYLWFCQLLVNAVLRVSAIPTGHTFVCATYTQTHILIYFLIHWYVQMSCYLPPHFLHNVCVSLTAFPGLEKRSQSSWHSKVMTASG